MADSNPSSPKTDLFAGLPRTEPLASESPAAAPSRPRASTRWIVPLVLFLAIVGGLAWLVQYMPAWRSPLKREVKAAPPGQAPLLAFAHPYNSQGYVAAVWEKKPKTEKPQAPYIREFERGAEGRYLFPLLSHPDEAVEIGLTSLGCDCARLHIAEITEEELQIQIKSLIEAPDREPPEQASWQWQLLEKSQQKGLVLPAGTYALLRMTWNNRRPSGESLNLSAKLWARQGAVRREEYGVVVPAVSTVPLRTSLDRADVGVLEPGATGKAEFLIWSPTREGITPAVTTSDDLVVARVSPLEAQEAATLQTKLRDRQINSRVSSAWRIAVQVHESKDKSRLPLGHFLRHINVQLPDAAEDPTTLVVSGFVRGPVEVGAVDDQSKVNLKSFPAGLGTRKTIFLRTDAKTNLKHKSTQPATVEVKLLESTQEKAASRRKWVLEVVVPPNQFSGTITDDNAVILEIDSQPPREIRIPIVGHAVQG